VSPRSEPRIEPRTLKGFQDVLPAKALRRAHLLRKLEDVFRAHGYGPIDTPSLEFAEILKGKGGEESDKQLFEFDDAGERRVALRFDLTVPLARFVAQHQNELVFPFRRYAIGHVWRGERPQKGRLREFMQCDADLVGAVGPAADAEILVLMASAYRALDVGPVTLRVNDRRILNGLLERLAPGSTPSAVLRVLDKRDRQGAEVVRAELATLGIPEQAAARLIEVTAPRADAPATLAALAEAVRGSPVGETGLAHLTRVRELVLAAGIPPAMLSIDPTIARGLDYYTGLVMEARLDALPSIGSVGSGGRYDDLAGLYTNTKLPGVGCSVGIDRLLIALEELELLAGGAGGQGSASAVLSPAEVLLTHPSAEQGPAALDAVFALSQRLRAEGLKVETFPEDKKHGQQMKYADRQGVAFALTRNPDGSWHGKNLLASSAQELPDESAVLAWLAAARSG
jgi:histidyl-tRNA synthetase